MIEWPEYRWVPDWLIEQWFLDAVKDSAIDPVQFRANTPRKMAEALHQAGKIRLASKQRL